MLQQEVTPPEIVSRSNVTESMPEATRLEKEGEREVAGQTDAA